MEAILLALSPLLVVMLTQAVKQIRTIQLSVQRKIVVRFIVAVLSFATVLLGSTVDGVTVDQTVIVTFAETVFVFLGSQAVYFLGKRAAE